LLEQNPGSVALPNYLHEQVVALFPPRAEKKPSGELIEFVDANGVIHVGHRQNAQGEEFEFRPISRTAPRFVSLTSLKPNSLRTLSPSEVRERVSIQQVVLQRMLDTLYTATTKPRFISVAIAYGSQIDRPLQIEFEQLLVDSPLQFEIRHDLANFPVAGRKAWSRVDLATARKRNLLGLTHLLLIDADPTDRAAGVKKPLSPELVFRQIDLATGNVLWQERGATVPVANKHTVAQGFDLPFLLQSGTLSLIRFRDRGSIPSIFPALARGPSVGNDFRVAFVESNTDAGIRVRPLFNNATSVEVSAGNVRESRSIDPDILLAEYKGYDPWFASWRIARHLLPAAGRVTRVELPLVEIDLGRKCGPKIGDEFMVRRLPMPNAPVGLSILPIRLKVREVRENQTIAELLAPSTGTSPYVPVIGDIAIHLPGVKNEVQADQTERRISKPRIAFLQIRSASQGTKSDVEYVPLLGPVLKATKTASPDRRA
jgi:hypothetical protein